MRKYEMEKLQMKPPKIQPIDGIQVAGPKTMAVPLQPQRPAVHQTATLEPVDKHQRLLWQFKMYKKYVVILSIHRYK